MAALRAPDVPLPVRILLVSDDDIFVEHVFSTTAESDVAVAHVGPEDDLEVAAFGHGATVLAVDIDGAPWRRVRAATAFARAHPGVPVVLATLAPGTTVLGGFPLVMKDSASLLRASTATAPDGAADASGS